MSFNGNLQPSSDEGTDLTTKGDIHGFSTENVRVPVGTDGQTLTARASNSNGIAWETAAGGGTDPNEVVMTYNTTIGDYTTNDGVTLSTGEAPDIYSTSFASSTGWTLQGNNTISGGKMNFQSTNGDNSIYDFTEVPQGYFRLRWSFEPVNYNSCGCNGAWNIGITDAIPTSASSGNVYGFGVSGHRHNSGTVDIDIGEWNNQPMNQFAGSGGNANAGLPNSAGTYYVELIKDGTNLTLSHYTDSTYTTQSGTYTKTVSATVAATLRYFVLASRHDNQSVNGSIGELSFNDGLCTFSVDGDPATQCQTNAGANQWLKADYGSAVNFGGLALYKGAANTETQWKLQASSDDATWTDLRTQNTSDYSGSGYDYVRFNVINARYIRVYGNSGSSAVVALNEIKSLQYTDGEVATGHGHLDISSSDTSLGMNGT